MRRLTTMIICFLLFATLGCASYYKVTDPASSKTYYTKDVDRHRDGSIEFKDSKTGAEVTLQSSEVIKISSDEFKENTKK
jgi:hypothetical protein